MNRSHFISDEQRTDETQTRNGGKNLSTINKKNIEFR